ncbi:acetyl-CoA carboxylase biotin carboxyl carrier protein [Pararhodobacter marinus]|uniref:acetyl-CoA carboxylase biotin carboxyl carrier protein n=1 Tax=Pararhodobacter marinus TaxID=2184063 RepID=UPI003513C8E3
MAELTRADIDEILKLVDGSEFDELKLEMGDLKLELRRRGANPSAPVAAPAPAPAAAKTSEPVAAPIVPESGGTEVPAPLLGTFWHAPRPGAAPFVKPGDTVQAETVIGIIEVMKLMNSVEAGIAGTVTEIAAPNGELVEHGQCLIRVRQA